jgi:hypothetical protein
VEAKSDSAFCMIQEESQHTYPHTAVDHYEQRQERELDEIRCFGPRPAVWRPPGGHKQKCLVKGVSTFLAPVVFLDHGVFSR